jgi:hypothetical protein
VCQRTADWRANQCHDAFPTFSPLRMVQWTVLSADFIRPNIVGLLIRVGSTFSSAAETIYMYRNLSWKIPNKRDIGISDNIIGREDMNWIQLAQIGCDSSMWFRCRRLRLHKSVFLR